MPPLELEGADEPAVRLVGITEEVGGAVPCTLSQSLNHQRIPQMVALTGGAFANACEEWYPRISETLGAAAGYRTQFPLSASPAGGAPPQVLVNGGLVAATAPSGEVIWSYDSSRNVVTFLPGHVPAPGSEVRLRYAQACHGGAGPAELADRNGPHGPPYAHAGRDRNVPLAASRT